MELQRREKGKVCVYMKCSGWLRAQLFKAFPWRSGLVEVQVLALAAQEPRYHLFFFFMVLAQACSWNGFWAKLSMFLSGANINICMHSTFSELSTQILLDSMQIKVCVCLTSQKRRQVPNNTYFLQVLALFRWSSWLVYWERLGTWQYRLQIYPSPSEKGRFKEGLQPWRYDLLRVFPLLWLFKWSHECERTV